MVHFPIEPTIFIELYWSESERDRAMLHNYKYQGFFDAFNDQLSQRNAITKQLLKSALAAVLFLL